MSVESLIDVLQIVLKIPFVQLEKMGRSGFLKVIEKHNVNIKTAKLAELFDKVI